MAKLTIFIQDNLEEKIDVRFDWFEGSFPGMEDVKNKEMTDAQIQGVCLMHLCKTDRLDKLYELVGVKNGEN